MTNDLYTCDRFDQSDREFMLKNGITKELLTKGITLIDRSKGVMIRDAQEGQVEFGWSDVEEALEKHKGRKAGPSITVD